MAEPGWYPDTTMAGTQRYWDGVRWTDHVAPLGGPAVPGPSTPQPRRRADGSIAGPSLASAVLVALVGIALVVASVVMVVPAFIDSVSGPRWQVPGSHEEDLETGTWMLYQRVGLGGFGTVGPADVTVDGPAPVQPRSDSAFTETITINEREYLGVVRFDVDEAGTYVISVGGEPSSGTEVLLARPLSSLGSYWPWFLAFAVGGVVIVVGVVLGVIGGINRGRAKRAGHAA